MGLMEWLFGKKGPEFTERILLTTEGKMNDLVRQVKSAQDRGVHSVVVTHFKATQMAVLDAFDKAGVNFHLITSSAGFPSNVADVLPQGKSTLVLASDAIPAFAARAAGFQHKDATLAPLSVHMAEHYPRPERDLRVLALDHAWPMRIEFIGYTGLDEPWMVAFGSERLQSIIQRLGMDKDEVLQHPWLNRSIRTAQQRVAQTVFRDQPCDSCEEWMQTNSWTEEERASASGRPKQFARPRGDKMNTAKYDAGNNSIVITIDGKTYAIPVQAGWRGTGQFALIGIASAANDLHGIWLPADIREQISTILKEQGF
jgi:hypothetical protein